MSASDIPHKGKIRLLLITGGETHLSVTKERIENALPEVEVVHASTYAETMSRLEEGNHDLVITLNDSSLNLPELTLRVKKIHGAPHIILSTSENTEPIEAAFKAGADGTINEEAASTLLQILEENEQRSAERKNELDRVKNELEKLRSTLDNLDQKIKQNRSPESNDKTVETLLIQIASQKERLEQMKRLEDAQKEQTRRLIEGTERVYSMVRHDLRGPLVTVRNAVELLKSDPGDQEVMRVIERSVQHASEILSDLRIKANPNMLKPVEARMRSLVEESLESIYIPDNVRLEVDLPENVDDTVQLDRKKIRRVIDNLIMNALEAMPEGGMLSVSMKCMEDQVDVNVEDTGVGIPDSMKSFIFTPMFTTKEKGMGLGLVYSRNIVMAHGGDVSFESTAGKGTVFTMSLPRKPKRATVN